jgi:hypothetical protein
MEISKAFAVDTCAAHPYGVSLMGTDFSPIRGKKVFWHD